MVQQLVQLGFKWGDRLLEASYDPAYVAAPKHRFQVFASINGGRSNFHLDVPLMNMVQGMEQNPERYQEFPEMDKLMYYKFRLHQDVQSASVGVGYGIVQASYTFNLHNSNERQFSMEALGTQFGCSFDYRHSKQMKGTAYNAFYGTMAYLQDKEHTLTADEIQNQYTAEIPDNRNDFTTLHAQVHYIFNYRHFSYSSVRTATRIQRKSAGSPLFVLDYYRSTARFQSSLLYGKDEKFHTDKGSVGLGYAYSFTPNQGRFILHASCIPSVNLLGKATYSTLFDGEMAPDQKEAVQQLQDYISQRPKNTWNATTRVSATWNMNEHYFLGAYGVHQYSNYQTKVRFKIQESYFSGYVFLGYRF